MTTTMNPPTEPSPAPDMSRAVPTTKALRAQFAALDPADKALVRTRVAGLVADGSKAGPAWTQAFADLVQYHQPAPGFTDDATPEELEARGPNPVLSDRDALFQRAMDRKKAGPRGKGRKLTQDELVAYIAEVRAQEPDADRRREMEIAYWLEGIALGRSRWIAAWDAATERLAS